MDLGPLASQAIRVSLPWNVTRADVDAFAAAYYRVSARLRTGIGGAADLDQHQAGG
jgi:cysteine desulfurase